MAGRITLGDIAERVGVTKSTVSDVLRNRQGKIRVGERTRRRIHQAVKELGYEPNGAARALATGRSNSIGFLLSCNTTLGLANNYFSMLMAGVQNACKVRGYNCVVSAYDLSTIRNFIMPAKMRQRSVDGVVISGHIEEEVIQAFIDSGIPFALIGESTDFPLEGLLSVAQDLLRDWLESFEHLYSLGHRHFAVGGIMTRRGNDIFAEAVEQFRALHIGENLEFESYCSFDSGQDSFDFARDSAFKWLDSDKRPTAVIGHDHWCIGFLSTVLDAGVRCPEDVSVMSTCDTPLCQWYRPSITSLSLPLFDSAEELTNILADVIEKKSTWVGANQKAGRIWQSGELRKRVSTGPAPLR